MLTKSETNNAVITRLKNVRKHPNADRLQLATILGTTVIVGLDVKDDDLVIYFDSNLRLSHDYLRWNNLYSSSEMNVDSTKKGRFGKDGKVRAQKFRGEMSNGYVAELSSLLCLPLQGPSVQTLEINLPEGTEFTHINGIEICSKYIVSIKGCPGQPSKPISDMFHKHWDTKQLMRQLDDIPEDAVCYIEEKIHGTSGRTGNVLCPVGKKWWRCWRKSEPTWRIVSGIRRFDSINNHIPQVRAEIERKVAPHLHKGEEIYYEIYGYDVNGSMIQEGYPYNCRPGEFKCMLYRVTITTPNGFTVDLNREQVYHRAGELGLEKPFMFTNSGRNIALTTVDGIVDNVQFYAKGRSTLDANTLREGVVVWFTDRNGNWTCLKHKSEEFLMDQDKKMEKEQGDVEDNL